MSGELAPAKTSMRATAIGHRSTRVTMSHVQPDPNKCHYWVERKGRYCRWPQMKGMYLPEIAL